MRFLPHIWLSVATFAVALFMSNDVLARDKRSKDDSPTKPEYVSLEWTELPLNYHPTTPKGAVKWINSVVSSEPPSDQFATSNEVSLRDDRIRAKIAEIGEIGLLLDSTVEGQGGYDIPCRLKYFPDDARLEYSLKRTSYAELKYVPRPTDKHFKIVLETASSEKGGFVGQNAFGAKAQVSRIASIDISIAVPYGSDSGALQAGILPMLPEKARSIVPRLKCFLVFSPVPPFTFRGWDTKAAALSDPTQMSTEDYVLFGSIKGVWLVDSATREVLVK